MTPVRVLMLHNRYLERGGEDESTEAEIAMLREAGHEVELLEEDNARVAQLGRARAALRAIWSAEARRRVLGRLQQGSFDLVHVQNFFPLLSPAVHWAAFRVGVPVVQTLRNYRLACANALLHRRGKPCEDCLGRRLPWPAVFHKCYRGSVAGSMAVAASQVSHRLLGTWSRVDAFIALTAFARERLIEAGLPAERVSVKPNFVHPDPGPGRGGPGFLFVGRLSPEKGVRTLLDAWRRLQGDATLEIIGEGPLADEIARRAAADPRITWLGRRPLPEVWRRMQDARAVVVPSESYETFGRVVVEAFACGTPVLASRPGALVELVEEGRTGRLFPAGDSTALAASVQAFADEGLDLEPLRAAARSQYERLYTPERNLSLLMEIYDAARRRQYSGIP